MIRLQTSLLTVPVVKLLLRTTLLAGLTAYWRLQTSHRPIEIRRTVRLTVLVARLMCQKGRLSVLIAMRLQTNLHLFALIAAYLQTNLHLSDLTARSEERRVGKECLSR